MNNAKKSFQILFSQTKDFIFFMVYSVLAAVFTLLGVLVLKHFLDDVIVSGNHVNTSLYVSLFVVDVIAFASSIVLRSNSKTTLTSKVTLQLARESYDSLLYADLYDESKEEVEEKVLKIIDNSEFIGNAYLRKNFLKFLETLTTIVVLFFSMLFIKPVLALIVMIGFPVFFVANKAVEKIIVNDKERSSAAINNLRNLIDENYKRVRTIKLLNSTEYEKEKFDELADFYRKAKRRRYVTNKLSGKVLNLVFNAIIIAIVLGLCGLLSANPAYNMTSGIVFSFCILTPYVFMNFKTLMDCNVFTSSISEALAELDAINKLKTERKTEPVATLEDVHTIKFKDVTYTNETGDAVVNNVSFEIKRGEKLGILTFEEETKEAILEMLTKLVKPKTGEISINNCDISKINTSYLREIITSVFSHELNLNDSIRSNVTYPLKFDDYKFNDSLYRSGIKDIVNSLPEKENTLISDPKITDDMKQRIIFANAFFKDSKIYLLKDATSDLSVSTEMDMVNEVLKLKNKIVVTITDRAYCLNKFDKIIILKNGEVVEYGTYDDLMKDKSSAFYKLIRRPSTGLRNIS